MPAMKNVTAEAPGFNRSSQTGIELSVNDRRNVNFYLVVMRRFDEAITEGQLGLACDPFSVRISQHLGDTFYKARRYQQTI